MKKSVCKLAEGEHKQRVNTACSVAAVLVLQVLAVNQRIIKCFKT